MKHLNLTLSLLLVICLLLSTALSEEKTPQEFICGDYRYILLDDGTAEITKYTGKDEILHILDTLDGYTVTRIGDRAFFWRSSLTIVYIPDSVTSIGDHAFYYCKNLVSISIPDSVLTVGINPFSTCVNLSSIMLSPNHPTLSTIENVLFEKSSKTLICYAPGRADTSYIIPEGTLHIGENAFCCTDLLSVSIPDTVMDIGKSAFDGCSELNDISFPNSVTVIGDNAFYQCSSLTSVSIPSSVESIGTEAFSWCTSLINVSFSDSDTFIGDKAFYCCKSLASISISDSIVKLGANPFEGCDNLMSVTVSPNHPTLSMIDNVLFEKSSNTLLFYLKGNPDTEYIIPYGIQHISDSAFSMCANLTSVFIPDSVTVIGKNAFYYCTSLVDLFIPDTVTEIGDDAFLGCSNLIITVNRDSYAATYCRRKGIRYTYSDSID